MIFHSRPVIKEAVKTAANSHIAEAVTSKCLASNGNPFCDLSEPFNAYKEGKRSLEWTL